MHHSVQWYIITNSKPELWHRKANPLEALLESIETHSPELAARIFYNLNECIGCREQCYAKTPYTYQSEKRLTCHGHIFFKMSPPDFQDVRELFGGLNSMLQNQAD